MKKTKTVTDELHGAIISLPAKVQTGPTAQIQWLTYSFNVVRNLMEGRLTPKTIKPYYSAMLRRINAALETARKEENAEAKRNRNL